MPMKQFVIICFCLITIDGFSQDIRGPYGYQVILEQSMIDYLRSNKANFTNVEWEMMENHGLMLFCLLIDISNHKIESVTYKQRLKSKDKSLILTKSVFEVNRISPKILVFFFKFFCLSFFFSHFYIYYWTT